MPEDRAHLARREVQHAPPLGVVDECPLGPDRHEIDEFAAVSEQMAPHPRPEFRLLPDRSAAFHGPAPLCLIGHPAHTIEAVVVWLSAPPRAVSPSCGWGPACMGGSTALARRRSCLGRLL